MSTSTPPAPAEAAAAAAAAAADAPRSPGGADSGVNVAPPSQRTGSHRVACDVPGATVWDARAARVAWWLLAAGVVLRLIRYAANRSLWLDEAYLAESILTYGFGRLATEPLLHWQAAPVGFLLLEKLAVAVLGTSEYALRAVPLIAGLAALPMFRVLVQRCLPPAGGLAALAMFATLEPLVYYGAEVKQYALDVAVTLAVFLGTLRVLERPGSFGRWVAMALIGACGIFLSHPAVFVLAGSGLILLGLAFRRREKRPVVAAVVLAGGWAALFGVNYFVFLRRLVRHEGLVAYWASAYMPRDLSAVPWLGRSLHAIFADYSAMWMPLADVAVVAAAIGVVSLWRRDRPAAVLILAPVGFAIAAAAVHRFPFSGRLILFVVPGMVLLLGAGMQAVLDAMRPARWLVPAAVFAVLFVPTYARGLYYAVLPPGREEMKPLLAHVRDRLQPGDEMVVLRLTRVPFGYYRDRFGLGPDRFDLAAMPWSVSAVSEPSEAAFAAEFETFRGRRRLWVLLTHTAALGGPDEGAIVPAVLDRMGRRLDERSARGAKLLLYDLTPAPATSPAPPTASSPPPPR